MKKINDWVIRTFGLRGSWSWAKKQMLNGAIIKRKATIGTYKIAIDNDKNRLLVATWDHLDDKGILNMWADINITDKYRSLEIDASKLFDHGILTEEYDKLRIINIH
jgi:hypothetical protein